MRHSVIMMVSLWMVSSLLYGQTAEAIMKKVYDRELATTSVMATKMVLTNQVGQQRVRRLKSYSLRAKENDQTMMFFLEPADVKNTGFYTIDYDDPTQDNDQWMYLPALAKIKRIVSSDKSQAFMGSDFTYGDLTRRHPSRYTYELQGERPLRDYKVWQIQSLAKTPTIEKEDGFRKAILYVRQDNYVVSRAIYYLTKGGRRKYFDVRKIKEVDGVWIPSLLSMITKKGKVRLHETTIIQESITVNEPISDSFFSLRTLEKGL